MRRYGICRVNGRIVVFTPETKGPEDHQEFTNVDNAADWIKEHNGEREGMIGVFIWPVPIPVMEIVLNASEETLRSLEQTPQQSVPKASASFVQNN